MLRIVSIWLPMWPIERMRRADPAAVPRAEGGGAEPPFALVESGAGGLRLAAINGRGRREGLRPGLALADARAALPGLVTRSAERERDRAALEALALWCGRYGPRRNIESYDVTGSSGSGRGARTIQSSAEASAPDGIWIDVTGVAHLFGGEDELLADLARRLEGFGLSASIGLADTAGAAFALARFAAADRMRSGKTTRWCVAAAGEGRAALAPLPVSALRLDPDTVLVLRRLGLARIGQLYGLPREALALRFRQRGGGASATRGRRQEAMAQRLAGAVLMRLDQALGLAAEPLAALEEPPVHLVGRPFAEPLISAEGVGTAAAGLVGELCELLADRGVGGSRFTMSLYRSDGSCARIGVGTSGAVHDPVRIMQLLAERLDGVDAGFGIDMMTMAADRVEAVPPRQSVLAASWAGRERAAGGGDDATDVLIDRLSNRLGMGRVLRMQAGDSHIPERGWIRVRAGAFGLGSGEPAGRRVEVKPATRLPKGDNDDVGWSAQQRSGAQVHSRCGGEQLFGCIRINRPQFLLQAPEPISVTAGVPEGPPLQFTWRRRLRRVVHAQGPERIEPEWWRAIGGVSVPRTRDYYAIEDSEGGRYWVFRAGLYGNAAESGDRLPAWYLHGVFA